ncbi:MAG: DUF4912 domain-containing protein [Gloeomargarita sp. SKYBB_i_bin120]|nr:DUF4912 domain-containing protein [Gloeomargarita sp. SKYG98]MCS7292930.1 DUF4912 domain-containing protein [Gloeomargarita sp. SKYB120]MDW8178495.1 DUF4912 domain-containing protein [Gloeomargarita sp. SKYBB_i_bin120]
MTQKDVPLEEMTLRELRRLASELGIARYSRMRKSYLVTAIRAAELQTTRSHQSPTTQEAQTTVDSDKPTMPAQTLTATALQDVDEGLPDLPGGYGESRIVLMPRDPQWAYAYWDIPNEAREERRKQGGQQLALRLYDVTNINLEVQAPHSVQEYACDELAREWYLPIPVSDRDYVVEIGYRTADGRWLSLARSAAVRIPPVYPSDWVEDHFITVGFEEDLRGRRFFQLVPPSERQPAAETPVYDEVMQRAAAAESMRVAGSLYGSMQHVPGSLVSSAEFAVSSYVFPSGIGRWAIPTLSGIGMSGVGFAASIPPMRPRKFWLVADAELIVYGATEPDATVTVGGRKIQLNPDGTFRFQMSFPDGNLDFPIFAVAADGEQTREIHMTFDRRTLSRRTNTREEAVEEWFMG